MPSATAVSRTVLVSREGRGWSVKAEGEANKFDSLDSKVAAVASAMILAKEQGSDRIIVRDVHGETEKVIHRNSDSDDWSNARVDLELSISHDLDSVWDKLAERTGLDRSSILIRSLLLYEYMVESREKGWHIGVTSDPKLLGAEIKDI